MPSPMPPPAPSLAVPPPVPGVRKRPAFGFAGFTRVVFSRPLGFVALLGFVLGAFVLPPTGINFNSCGFHASTGLPCVGCGLTRSVTCFLQGDFALSVVYHPFGSVFAVGFILLGLMAVLPERWRAPLLLRLESWDVVLGVATIAFFLLLIIYGIYRISLVVGDHPDHVWWKTADAPPLVTNRAIPDGP
jgi:hypothetical protein